MPLAHSAGNVVSLESGIDWITWVAPRSVKNGALEHLGARLIESQAARGSQVKPLRIEGYEGSQAEGCAYGYRKDSEYLRMSGNLAASQWRSLVSASGHPTRVDVQTTLLLKQSDSGLGMRVFRQRTGAAYPQQGRPRKRILSQGSTGLFLGTVGTRTGREYLRIYDKGVESGTHEIGHRWRIELEAKKDLAKVLWAELCQVESETEWCKEKCRSACWHARSQWPLPANSVVQVFPPQEPKELMTTEATLKWLHTAVAPSVSRMVMAVGTEEVLAVLGLDGYAEAFSRRGRTT